MDDPGFDYSVLSEFRHRLLEGKTEEILLEKLLERCEEVGLLKGKKKQWTDSTHGIAAVRALTLLELVGDSCGELWMKLPKFPWDGCASR